MFGSNKLFFRDYVAVIQIFLVTHALTAAVSTSAGISVTNSSGLKEVNITNLNTIQKESITEENTNEPSGTNVFLQDGLNQTNVDMDIGKQQGPQPDNIFLCVSNGHSCELFMNRRLCCSGNPCKPVPNQILQLLTMGAWGVCH